MQKRPALIVGALITVLVIVGIAFLSFDPLSIRTGTEQDTQGTPSVSFDSVQEEKSSSWNSSNNDSEVGALVRILSPYQRRLALDDLLADSTSAHLRDLLKQTKTVQPKHLRNEFQEGIVRKLATIDSTAAISLLDEISKDGQSTLISGIFEEWSAVNPVQASEHLVNLEEPQQHLAIQGMLLSGAELPNDVRRRLSLEFDIEQFELDQAATAVLSESIDDPEELWYSLTADYTDNTLPSSDIQLNAMVYVALDWLKRDRLSATEAIMDSFPLREDRITMVEEILKGLVESNFDDLRGFAANIEQGDRVVLSRAFAGWASKEGVQALQAAGLMDSEDTTDPNRMKRAVIDSWAANHPHSLYSALPQIPEDLRTWSQQTALIAMGKSSPESIPALLKDVKDKKIREMIVINVIDDWAKVDPYAAFQWASDPSIEKLPGDSAREVFQVIARQNPHAALAIARTFPRGEGGIGREADVISAMARLDVDTAIGMLDSARNKATRRSAYDGIGMALILEGDSDRAIELVKDEPRAVQNDYFSGFIYMWAEYGPRDMLNKLGVLPTDEVRQMCASYLLKLNESDPFLNTEDMQKLEQYVDESELHLLQHTAD